MSETLPGQLNGSADQVSANKRLVEEFFDGFWNRGDESVLHRMLDEKFEFRMLGEAYLLKAFGMDAVDYLDRPTYIKFVTSYRAAFPDMRGKIEDIIAEGDKVAIRWKNMATHGAAFLNVPATGKRLSLEGVVILRVRDGKICDGWGIWNPFENYRQMIAASP